MQIEMTIDEISVVYGLLCAVNQIESEVSTSELRDRLGDIVEDFYPGYDAVPHFVHDMIEIYKD